ncbi:hypothetical protein KC352_g5378, partial [Hortaea werneckii]
TKRKPSETAAETDAANGNNSKKQKRRKVNHACVYCRRSHMTCDLERPCTRCVKRDIGHLCHDEPREGPKRTKSDGGAVSGADVGGVAIAPAPTEEPERSGGGMMGAQMDGGVGGGAGPGMQFPGQGAGGMPVGNGINGTGNPVTAGQQGLPQPDQLSPVQLQRQQPPPPPPPAANMASGAPQTTNPANLQMNNFDWNNHGNNNNNSWNQFQDMHHLHPNYMFNTSEVTNEYNLLNDFLSSSLLDDGAMYSTDEAQTLFNDPLLSTSSINALSQNFGQQTPNQQQQPQPQNRPPSQHQHHIQPQHLQQSPHQQQQQQQPLQPSNQPTQHHHQQQPHHPPQQPQPLQPPPPKPGEPSTTSTDPNKARNNYFLTAADPAGLTSASDRLHKLLRAKYDAGMLKPFNYVRGYARLQSYLSRHLLPSSQRRILSQLSRFRPKFREAMQELTDMQLVLVEMWFERSLMEYDRVFASMAIPACCWRRTGEIFRGNREMAELIGVGMESLRDGRLAIHEVLEEESLVSYWEKFGAIAFDGSQKAILTSCSVKVPGDGRVEGEGGGGGCGGSGSARREGSSQQQGQQQAQQKGRPEDSRTSTTNTEAQQGKNPSSSPLANKHPDHNNTNKTSNHTQDSTSGNSNSNSNSNSKGKEVSDSGAPATGGNQAGGTSGSVENSARNGGGSGAGASGGPATVRTKKCCFSFTIRRDNHNIPALIVGNFLPIRPRNGG